MDVIARIDEIMKKQGLNQYKLSKLSGLSQSTLSNMYLRNTIPTVPTLETICKALNITLAQFFAEDSDEFFPVNEKQKEVLDLYIKLDNDQQDAIISIMKTMHPKNSTK